MLELWGMQTTPLLPSLPGPLWVGVIAPNNSTKDSSNESPGYDANQSDGEASVTLEL